MADCIVPEGYKKTLLGVIPKEWKVKRLELLCSNKGDYGINAPAVTYSKDLPTYLRITDIDDDGRFITADKTSVNSSNSENFRLKEGDILFARTGATVGKTYLYNPNDGDLVFAGFLIRFSLDTQKIIPSFLRAYTNTSIYWNWAKIISQRSGQPGINAAEYCSLQIPVPPLTEQQKIVEILSVWDKAIEKQTQLIAKLELRKKGLMQQLLTGKKRLPGFSEEWKDVKLGTLFIERNEINRANLPLLSITADRGVIFQSESDKRDISNDDKSKYKRICPNDIGYNTMRMWQGRCALSSLEGIVSPAYSIITPNKDVNPHYMEMLFKQPFTMYCFWTHSQGLVSDTLNCKFHDFSQIKVTIPSLKEQNAISYLFMEINHEIDVCTRQLNLLYQEKKGLMQVLLTGKKRVTQ